MKNKIIRCQNEKEFIVLKKILYRNGYWWKNSRITYHTIKKEKNEEIFIFLKEDNKQIRYRDEIDSSEEFIEFNKFMRKEKLNRICMDTAWTK